jgi:hypothetical protein
VEWEDGAEQEEGEPEHGDEVCVEGKWCEPESHPQTRVGWRGDSVRVGAFRRLTGLGGPAPFGDDDFLVPCIECADGDGCCSCGGGGLVAADRV